MYWTAICVRIGWPPVASANYDEARTALVRAGRPYPFTDLERLVAAEAAARAGSIDVALPDKFSSASGLG